MRTPCKSFGSRDSRTLMNEPSSLNHRPDCRSWTIVEESARILVFCAASSAGGAIHSPMMKVRTTNAMPIFASVAAAAAATLAKIGMAFVVLTFIIGEWIAPPAEEAAQKTKIRALSSTIVQDLQSGLWFKDEGSFINVRESRDPKLLQGVRIYEFDPDYRLRKITLAERAEYRAKGLWDLYGVMATRFDAGPQTSREPRAEWHTGVSPDL